MSARKALTGAARIDNHRRAILIDIAERLNFPT